jgi:hypothetical protein
MVLTKATTGMIRKKGGVSAPLCICTQCEKEKRKMFANFR